MSPRAATLPSHGWCARATATNMGEPLAYTSHAPRRHQRCCPRGHRVHRCRAVPDGWLGGGVRHRPDRNSDGHADHRGAQHKHASRRRRRSGSDHVGHAQFHPDADRVRHRWSRWGWSRHRSDDGAAHRRARSDRDNPRPGRHPGCGSDQQPAPHRQRHRHHRGSRSHPDRQWYGVRPGRSPAQVHGLTANCSTVPADGAEPPIRGHRLCHLVCPVGLDGCRSLRRRALLSCSA